MIEKYSSEALALKLERLAITLPDRNNALCKLAAIRIRELMPTPSGVCAAPNQKELYRTVYGSKLYGTATESSDTDYKAIIVPSLKDMVLGAKLVNVVQQTNDSANTASDVDIEYIPLQVFIRDFACAQLYAYELAFAILQDPSAQQVIKSITTTLVDRFLTSNIKPIVGYARNQIHTLSTKGARYTALTRLAAHAKFAEAQSTSTVTVGDMMLYPSYAALAYEYPKFISHTSHVIVGSTPPQRAVTIMDKQYLLSMPLRQFRQLIEQRIATFGSRSITASSLSDVDWKGMMHATRILSEACELLSRNTITFPVPQHERELLLDIRAGKFSLEYVTGIIEAQLELLEKLAEWSLLPKTFDVDQLEDFIYDSVYSTLLLPTK